MKYIKLYEDYNASIFKLGIDYHGVIDSIPSTFAFLSNAVVKNGGEVHLITGGSWTKKLEDEVKSHGINYTTIFSVYDYLLDNGYEKIGNITFKNGDKQIKFKNSDWDSIKAKYCSDNKISLHIDDTTIYNDFFKTPFARLWTHNGKSKNKSKDVRHIK